MNSDLRAWAEIRLDALQHNLKLAQECAGKPVMAVIKGDAHGHGAVRCALALREAGAAAFAVACLQEAIELRDAGITEPILILGRTAPSLAGALSRYGLTQSVYSEEYAAALQQAAEDGASISIHIKLDTGMSRTGLSVRPDPHAAAGAVLRIAAMPALRLCGIFTHLAAADLPEMNDFTAMQLDGFRAALRELEHSELREGLIRHAANSAGILWHPDAHFDMVRAGVMLYGFYPDGIHRENGPLEPVLSLKARVAQVKTLSAGDKVSYGCLFEAPAAMKIAVVTAGYADSYPRSLTGKGAWAMIGENRCPQIGRICMDMCMFDVTGTDVRAGDEVILYGRGGMSLDALAQLAGTINCEPTCLLTRRVKKIYLNG